MTDLVALGVQTPQINAVQNFQASQTNATNQLSAQQQQEAASLEHIAQMGFGVMGGDLKGQIDPKRFDTMLTLLGNNPLAAKLKENPEMLRTITAGSANIVAQSQNAQQFEMEKKKFDLELKNADIAAQKARFQEVAPGATLHDVSGQTPDFTAPNRDPSGDAGMYQRYVDQETTAGREPLGVIEFKQALQGNGITMTNPDGSTVTIGGKGTTGDQKYDQTLGTSLAKTFQDTQDAAGKGISTIGTLKKMKSLLGNDAVYTGIGASQVQDLQKAAVSLGIADPTEVKDTESFNSLAKAATLDKMGGSLGTGVSNADRDYIDAQVPNIANTKAGNLQIIDIQTKLAQRQIDIAKEAAKYADDHGGRLDYKWTQHLADWAEANPLFPEAKSDTGGGKTAPEGVEQNVWDHMTADERALWQN